MLDSTELYEQMQRLAESQGFRWEASYKYYLGLHRGVIFKLVYWDGTIRILCASPHVSLVERILNDFPDAEILYAAGIPPSWLRGMRSDPQPAQLPYRGGLLIELDAGRFEVLGESRFEQLIDRLSWQFHEWGAPERVPCSACDNQEAEAVALIDAVATPLCRACWNGFQMVWPVGRTSVAGSRGDLSSSFWVFVRTLFLIFLVLLTAIQIFVWLA